MFPQWWHGGSLGPGPDDEDVDDSASDGGHRKGDAPLAVRGGAVVSPQGAATAPTGGGDLDEAPTAAAFRALAGAVVRGDDGRWRAAPGGLSSAAASAAGPPPAALEPGSGAGDAKNSAPSPSATAILRGVAAARLGTRLNSLVTSQSRAAGALVAGAHVVHWTVRSVGATRDVCARSKAWREKVLC
jgi:hypothetical protein